MANFTGDSVLANDGFVEWVYGDIINFVVAEFWKSDESRLIDFLMDNTQHLQIDLAKSF